MARSCVRWSNRTIPSQGTIDRRWEWEDAAIYFLQQGFRPSDPAVEEALYDSAEIRQFVAIDLGREPVPDETAVCKFRHLLEEHQLGEQIERVPSS